MCKNIEFIGMERKLCSVTFRPVVKDRAPASSDHDFWVRRIPLTSSAEAASFTVVANMRGKGGLLVGRLKARDPLKSGIYD
jgi:hypothetical protein